MDQAALTLICPENLLFPFYVVLDHLVGSIQNRLGRTVVLLQLDDRSFRKIFFIVQNIVDVGTPELVDRLIVITYNTKIAVFIRQQTDQLKLRRVGILILIHHNVQKTLLIVRKHLWTGFEQLYGFDNQVIKIECIVLFQSCLIFLINGRDFLLGKISHRGERIFRRGNQLVLCGRNCGHQAPFLINLRINLQLFADLFDDVLAVIRIVNRKICRIAEVVDVTSQNPHAGGVKRRNPDLFRAVPDQIVHSFTHLPGSFIGKGDRQNIPRLYAFVLNQIGNTVRQHPGLSASRSRQNQHRSLCFKNSFPLSVI